MNSHFACIIHMHKRLASLWCTIPISVSLCLSKDRRFWNTSELLKQPGFRPDITCRQKQHDEAQEHQWKLRKLQMVSHYNAAGLALINRTAFLAFSNSSLSSCALWLSEGSFSSRQTRPTRISTLVVSVSMGQLRSSMALTVSSTACREPIFITTSDWERRARDVVH